MNIRSAKISDVEAIYSLINFYAERDKMLFRSMADIYENLQAFTVAELDGRVARCCALQIIWSDCSQLSGGVITNVGILTENPTDKHQYSSSSPFFLAG